LRGKIFGVENWWKPPQATRPNYLKMPSVYHTCEGYSERGSPRIWLLSLYGVRGFGVLRPSPKLRQQDQQLACLIAVPLHS
jgi:hypothetical protein